MRKFEKILVVEDQDMANWSVRKTVESLELPSPMYSYHAENAIVLLTKAASHGEPYDLLVTDLYFESERTGKQMPDGKELVRAAHALESGLKILVFSSESKIGVIRQLYDEFGIDGYVRKARGDAQELKTAIEHLAQNRRYYPREYRSLSTQDNQHEFTDYDKTLVRLLNEGYSQQEIANWLEANRMTPSGLSSVEKRLKLMRTAMKFSKNQQLIGYCIEFGLI